MRALPHTPHSPNSSRASISLLLGCVGLLLICTPLIRWSLTARTVQASEQLVQNAAVFTPDHNTPVAITIPWRVDTLIEPAYYLETGTWTTSKTAASFWVESAQPGENGNIVLYAHNTRELFGNIRVLQGGEVVTIRTQDNTEYRYEVTEWYEVGPNETRFLEPSESELLTLFTCTGWADQQRFIVRARPLQI